MLKFLHILGLCVLIPIIIIIRLIIIGVFFIKDLFSPEWND